MSENVKPVKSGSSDILHFEKWLSLVGKRNATDIHLTVGNVPMLRIDGSIEPLLEEDVLTSERMERIIQYLFSEEEIAKLAKEKILMVGRTLKKVMRFRAHAFYSRGYLALSLRHLKEERNTIDSLGLPEVFKEFASADHGFVAITGPFDSGRTTTLRSVISLINHSFSKYIVTIEKPVEYTMPSDKSVVVQREVGRDVDSFEAGLETLHEEDVDVVAVGSLPNKESIESALRLANSGKLVFAIFGARHSLGVLEEIKNFFPPQEQNRILSMLSDSIVGIVTQVLIPKIGGGRFLATEVLCGTNPIKSLIQEGKLSQIPSVMQTSGSDGMITLDRSLVNAVKIGAVSFENARKQAIDPNQFTVLVSR